jgi:hypothetical protein
MSTLGLDRSGNGNDFIAVNITANDQMVDSPTNNFPTLNPLNRVYTGSTFSEGNLKITGTAINNVGSHSSMNVPLTGKWYAEFLILAFGGGECLFGVNHGVSSFGAEGVTYRTGGGSESTGTHGNTYNAGYGATWTTGDVMAITYDADTNGGQVTFYKNNASQGTPETDTNTKITEITGQLFFGCQNGHASTSTFMWNFGQDSSFAGNKTAQGNQDGNGIGDFYYAPPTGFLALCTKNLPEPTVDPRNHFNALTWTGDGSENAVTGVGFTPDCAWIKNTTSAEDWGIYDTLRGATKVLIPSDTDAEATLAQGLKSFDADGFTLGTDNDVAENTAGFVGWNWKAGGSGSSNSNGSITSTVSANAAAGFSMITYTGDGGTSATIGHGLSSAPEMIIVKRRSSTDDWMVYHSGNTTAPATDYLVLNTVVVTADEVEVWNDTAPTSSVFTVGTADAVNASDETYVAYCWHSVEGYSKVGAYVGNGGADGTFVYTGFKPALVIAKTTDRSGGSSWLALDNKRSPINPVDDGLKPDDPAAQGANTAEYSRDHCANGFKIRNAWAGLNGDGLNYVYWAFAETPFKYSNAE